MSEPDPGRFQRQHPLSWIFPALAAVRSTVVPAIIFLVFWQGWVLGWLAVFLVLPALALGVARYLVTTYALAPAELVVRDGILSRNERRVRYSRIQNVDEVQGPLHRLLGIVTVRVETASGGEPEAVLTLAPAAVSELTAAVFAERERSSEEEERPPLVVVPAAEIARLGLIKNRGFVVVAALIGILWQFGSDFAARPWERLGEWGQRSWSGLAASELVAVEIGTLSWIAGMLFLLAGFYLLLSALSIILALIRFGGFTLRRQGDDLIASYGLLSRLRVTVPRRRIQRLQVDESLLHRLWRRVSIRLDTAGGGAPAKEGPFKDADAAGGGRQWLVPITTHDRVDDLVAEALPTAARHPLAVDPEAAAANGEEVWRRIDPRAEQRLFNRTSLLVLVVTFGLTVLSRWSLLIPLVALPLVWWVGRRSIAARRYWPTADALWWRRGWPGRRLVVLPYDKIQSVHLAESPFDRRYGMAAVTVDTANSGLLPAAQISYLARPDAVALARHLAREAGRSEFVWS